MSKKKYSSLDMQIHACVNTRNVVFFVWINKIDAHWHRFIQGICNKNRF